MTRAKYTADTNELQELPSMDKPAKRVAQYKSGTREYFQCVREWATFNAHASQLRTISCDPSCREVFKDNQEYEEGKDYEVRNSVGTLESGSMAGGVMAFPITGMTTNDWMKVSDEAVKTEDELWREALDTLVGAGHYAVRANHVIEELKKHYTLIKK